MTTPNRPNFFILLGLNPDLPWNQTLFDNALRAKRGEWSRQGAGIARQALRAKQNLILIPEINRVMNDPDEREKEAINARVELTAGMQARQELFERHLAFINAKAFADDVEINKLVEDFKDILSAQAIRKRITIPVKAPGPSTSRAKQQLDAIQAKDIADRLQLLHMETLYELLQRPYITATPTLYRAAEELYSDMVRRSPTGEVTVKAELAGLTKEVFKSDEMRARYDETLRQSSLELLLKELDAMMARTTDKKIYARQIVAFLNNAQQKGWGEQEALDRFEEHCRKRKWFMQTPMIDPNAQKLLCPNCKTLNERTERNCIDCGILLFIDCPRCRKEISCVLIVCDACQFPVGNRFSVDLLLQDMPNLLKSDNLQDAEKAILEAEACWPAEDKDERTRKINKYKNDIKKLLEDKQQAQKDLVEQLDRLIGQKNFFAAKELLNKITGITLPDLKERRRDIEEKIKQARIPVQRILSGNLSEDEKINLCRQALALCADYKEAQDILSTMPPSPPRNLQAITRSKIVSLEWEPSPTQGCVYTIVRKSGARPNSLKDGLPLDTVTGLNYDDSSPEIGLPLYYAVFAILNTISSARAAHLRQSVMMVQDVLQFAVAEVNSQLVALSWEPPPYVDSIIIVRKEQSRPNSHLDGKHLPYVAPTQKIVEDRDVQNNHIYYYGIYCQFEDGNGHLQTSSGLFTSVIPKAPPATRATMLLQQMHEAFTEQNWDGVTRIVDYLSRTAPDSLSSEIYYLQGQAFLKKGNKLGASESLHFALALTNDTSQRLTLLEQYTEILISLDRWSEAFRCTQEALRLTPNNAKWLALQQQSLAKPKSATKRPPQEQPPLEVPPLPVSPAKALNVFFSYSHKDKKMRVELEDHLSILKRQYPFNSWHDGEIVPGGEWAEEIDKYLGLANIILLLVSPQFIASDYCYEKEVKRSLERHDKGEACVIPIILRPSPWQMTYLGKLQALPTGGKPITRWSNRDEAFLNVVIGLQRIIDEWTANRVEDSPLFQQE